jgi:hypothetical protein
VLILKEIERMKWKDARLKSKKNALGDAPRRAGTPGVFAKSAQAIEK